MTSSYQELISVNQDGLSNLSRFKRSLLVGLNGTFVIVGLASGTLVIRFYFENGAKSKWMGSLTTSVGFPILFIPYFFFHHLYSSKSESYEVNEIESSSVQSPYSLPVLVTVYIVLGIISAAANILASVSLSYLSASTYALISTTQLGFICLFSIFINGEKMTVLKINSIVILALSSSLIAVNSNSDVIAGVSHAEYLMAILLKLIDSALYALLFSLSQLNFEKMNRKKTYSVVIEQVIWTSLVGTMVKLIGLFASGEWKKLRNEMNSFESGELSYVMTLIWASISLQICSIGQIGLVFLVSSVFANVATIVSLAVTPIAAVILFNDKIGVKIISMLTAFWGLISYVYQQFIDENVATKLN